MQDQSKVNREIMGRPWWKTFLIVCTIILVLTVVISSVISMFFGGSGPRVTSQLPKTFPTNFVVYRIGLVERIVYYPASEKDKPLRLIMLPVKAVANLVGRGTGVSESMDRFLGAIQNNETVTMTWKDVEASPDEVLAFYVGSMRSAGIIDPQMRQTEEKDVSQIVGVAENGLRINVLIIDDANTEKVDSITVAVEYPSQ